MKRIQRFYFPVYYNKWKRSKAFFSIKLRFFLRRHNILARVSTLGGLPWGIQKLSPAYLGKIPKKKCQERSERLIQFNSHPFIGGWLVSSFQNTILQGAWIQALDWTENIFILHDIFWDTAQEIDFIWLVNIYQVSACVLGIKKGATNPKIKKEAYNLFPHKT